MPTTSPGCFQCSLHMSWDSSPRRCHLRLDRLRIFHISPFRCLRTLTGSSSNQFLISTGVPTAPWMISIPDNPFANSWIKDIALFLSNRNITPWRHNQSPCFDILSLGTLQILHQLSFHLCRLTQCKVSMIVVYPNHLFELMCVLFHCQTNSHDHNHNDMYIHNASQQTICKF